MRGQLWPWRLPTGALCATCNAFCRPAVPDAAVGRERDQGRCHGLVAVWKTISSPQRQPNSKLRVATVAVEGEVVRV
jgi:hypothetical protein